MTMPPEDESSSIWTEKTQKPDESFDKKYWRKIFITSCFLAVLVDPLFLYVPILMDDFKCLMLDPKLKIATLLLRTVTDLFYLMDIIIRIYRLGNYSSGLFDELDDRQNQMNFSFRWKSCVRRIAKTIWASIDILIDIVALLPLPQVAILIFFSKMSDLRYMTKTRMVIMNIFALSQYVPRVFRIYLSFMEIKGIPKEEIKETSIWVKGLLNISMYLMASHVSFNVYPHLFLFVESILFILLSLLFIRKSYLEITITSKILIMLFNFLQFFCLFICLLAMWYFFAIQRMMRCWHFACRKDDGCDNKIFRCHDHHAFRNTTILNDLCPLISSDTVPSNFGIFASVLQYGIVGSTNYFQKFSNCFCWGLQNLSSFGSNLRPSADGWENLYTALVSIIGLLLFLYLIGNLQMYMQIAATRTEDHKHRLVMKQKRKEKGREIELLLFKNGIATRLNKNIKSRIMGKVKQALYDSMDADLNNIFPLLPSEVQSRIKEPLAWLKQVPIFREMDEVVLKKIYEHLEPVKYNENNDIIQKGQPLDKMIFIVDGELCDSYSAPKLYGEELLRWPFSTSFPHTKPLATESVKAILTKKDKKSVKAIGVVEALALKACDLESIYMQLDTKRREEPRHKKMMKEETEQHMHLWMRKNGIPERLNNDIKLRIMKNLALDYWNTLPFDWYDLVSRLPLDFQNEIKSYMPLTKLKQMSEFENMEESVLKQICSHLRPMKYYDGEDIIAKGDPIQMLFIVDGYISDLSFNEKGPGEIYGEELLLWPFLTSFPHRVPTAAESPYVVFEGAEVLVLTAKYMESVATVFRKHFIKNYGRLVQNLVNYTSPAVTMSGPSSSEAVVQSFTEEEIKEAIRNHSCHNYKNEGGYGIVHEAALHGTAVTIKTCNSAPIGNRFIQSQHLVHEAFVLSQIRHKNVVRLLGCCLESKWPIMVYDRTCAWTLYELIHMKKPKLLLESRMKIAAETAGALKYLHSISVIHQDVKTANILIDHATHIAKLSGFGASRLLVDDEGEMEDEVSTLAETQWLDDDDGATKDEVLTLPESWGEDEVSTFPESWGEDEVSTLPDSWGEDEVSTLPRAEVSTLPETTGYSDPEYLESHVLTEKSDVYSFGVVLVELLTSQEAVSSDGPERFLANTFVCSEQEDRLDQILDGQVIKDNFTNGIAKKVSKIAVTCLRPRGKERPSMEEVAAELDRVVQTIMNRAKPSTEDNNISPGSRTSE